MAAAINFGTSLYSLGQIQRLNNEIEADHEATELVAVALQETDLKVNDIFEQMAANKKILTKLFSDIEKLNRENVLHSYLGGVQSLLLNFNLELDEYLSGVLHLTHNRLSSLLLKVAKVEETWQEIVSKAAKNNIRPINNDRNLIFNSQVSILALPDPASPHNIPEIIVIAHLPVVSGANHILLCHVSTPFLIGDIFAVLQGASFLSLSLDQATAAELSEADLLRCTQFGESYFCPQYNKVSNWPSHLCLYDLYFNLSPSVYCETKVSDTQSFGYDISPGDFLIGSLQPQTLALTCSNGTDFTEKPAGTRLVRLAPSCSKLSIPRFLLFRQKDLHMEAELQERKVTIPDRPRSFQHHCR